MSLSHLVSDIPKPYLDIRVANCKVDDTLIADTLLIDDTISGTINTDKIHLNPPQIINNTNTQFLTLNSITNDVELSSLPPDAFTDVRLEPTATGQTPIFSGQSALQVNLYGLLQSSGISITPAGSDLVFASTLQNTLIGSQNLFIPLSQQIKRLTASTGISLNSDTDQVFIENSNPSTLIQLQDEGLGTYSIIASTSLNPTFKLKKLNTGTGISISDVSDILTINNTDSGSSVTLSNAGTTSLVNDGTGPALATKGLVAGTNINFGTSATDVTINNSIVSSGTGTEVVLSGATIKRLTSGTGISLASDANQITITNSDLGSSVTLANGGANNTLVQDGVGPALATKSISGTSNITITPTATNVQVSCDILDSGVGSEAILSSATVKRLTATPSNYITLSSNSTTITATVSERIQEYHSYTTTTSIAASAAPGTLVTWSNQTSSQLFNTASSVWTCKLAGTYTLEFRYVLDGFGISGTTVNRINTVTTALGAQTWQSERTIQNGQLTEFNFTNSIVFAVNDTFEMRVFRQGLLTGGTIGRKLLVITRSFDTDRAS